MALSRESRDYQALLETVVGEAVGEGREGQIAVAWVVMNRVRDSRWPNNIYDVCHQPWQFECFTNQNLGRLMQGSAAREIDRWLPNVYVDTTDPTKGANHYYAFKGPYAIAAPDWTLRGQLTAEINQHQFFRL